jgi:hypothetical protein
MAFILAIGRTARICLLTCLLGTISTFAHGDELQAAFKNPPRAARPWVFWYWNKGAISREGITADLEAMRDAGLGGAYLMTIKGPDPKLWDPPVVQLTPEWWAMIRHAISEADRLGLEIAMHVCDGFATAGGPWVTADISMQKVVWSETFVSGDRRFTGKLPQPETNEDYYHDIATFAIPVTDRDNASKPRVTTSLADFDPSFLTENKNGKRIRLDAPGWIQYEFAKPFSCRSITIYPDGNSFQANRLLVSVSDDGETFRDIGRLEPPRHGWQNGDGTVTHAIKPTTGRFFRFSYDPAGTEPGAEDLDSAKWKPSLKLRGIELSSQPRLHQFEGKNGSLWRVSRRTTKKQLVDAACVPSDKIINISEHVQEDGTLDWQAPEGEWLILRMGHTSTGTHNETGGGGRGLECDKFDPKVVQLQYDRWFGEIIRQVGPETANRVLKGFHVDSWECGSQNWSHQFADEFNRRRGYELLPYLPVLAGIPIGNADESERVLFDVRQTIADLIADNFFGTLERLAHDEGCWFSAECVAPTMVSDGMRHFSKVDIPMGEFWLRSPTHDKPNDMRDAISAAHVYGKPIVQAEAFTELRMAWDEHPGLLKSLGDLQLCAGANRLVYHVFNHNPWLDRRPGMTLDAIGLYFQQDQTWWPAAKAWVEYHARCQALLQLGTPVVDIAVFTGEEVPSRAVLPETLITTLPGIVGKEAIKRETERLANVGNPQRELPSGVNASANITDPQDWHDPLRGYAYDSVNADALLSLAEVKDGRICFPGGASYQLLVLPARRPLAPHPESISPLVASRIEALIDGGATVVNCVHNLDKASVTDNERRGAIQAISSGRVNSGPIEADSFSTFGIEPDFLGYATDGKRVHDIVWNHRRSNGADWYFLSNQSDAVREVVASFRITGKRPELWDPLTGVVSPAQKWVVIRGRTVLPLRLESNGSMFVVFREATDVTGEDNGTNSRIYKTLAALNSPWNVSFDPSRGRPDQPVEFQTLMDWASHSDAAIRHYSGTAIYRQAFKWNNSAPRVWIDLGEVASMAEVRVNNIACGFAWTPPYRVEITKALRPAENELEIAVTNTWANRLIGDAKLAPAERLTWMTAPYPPADAELLPAGLLGPVTLVRAVESESK